MIHVQNCSNHNTTNNNEKDVTIIITITKTINIPIFFLMLHTVQSVSLSKEFCGVSALLPDIHWEEKKSKVNSSLWNISYYHTEIKYTYFMFYVYFVLAGLKKKSKTKL